MKRKSSGINVSAILTLIFTVLTIIVIHTGVQSSKCPKNCTETVEATPLGYNEKTYTDDEGTVTHKSHVIYEYEYEGKKYTCSAKFSSSSRHYLVDQIYKKEIKIDPNNPSKYYVPGSGGINGTLVAVFATLAIVFGKSAFNG